MPYLLLYHYSFSILLSIGSLFAYKSLLSAKYGFLIKTKYLPMKECYNFFLHEYNAIPKQNYSYNSHDYIHRLDVGRIKQQRKKKVNLAKRRQGILCGIPCFHFSQFLCKRYTNSVMRICALLLFFFNISDFPCTMLFHMLAYLYRFVRILDLIAI